MGILVKKETPTISKYTIEGESTLYLGIDRHPFTMGKVIFFYNPDNLQGFKDREHLLSSPLCWQQIEGYNIVILEDGFNHTPTLPPPEQWEIQRDINSMCEWYVMEISKRKRQSKIYKVK